MGSRLRGNDRVGLGASLEAVACGMWLEACGLVLASSFQPPACRLPLPLDRWDVEIEAR